MLTLYRDWSLLRRIAADPYDLADELDITLPFITRSDLEALLAEAIRLDVEFPTDFDEKTETQKINYLIDVLRKLRAERIAKIFRERKSPNPASWEELMARLQIDSRWWLLDRAGQQGGKPEKWVEAWIKAVGDEEGEIARGLRRSSWFRGLRNACDRESVAKTVLEDMYYYIIRNAESWLLGRLEDAYESWWWAIRKEVLGCANKYARQFDMGPDATGDDDPGPGAASDDDPPPRIVQLDVDYDIAQEKPLSEYELRRLQEYCDRLTDLEREVLRSRYVEGNNIGVIGPIIGVAEARAYLIHGRAIRKLRRYYADDIAATRT